MNIANFELNINFVVKFFNFVSYIAHFVLKIVTFINKLNINIVLPIVNFASYNVNCVLTYLWVKSSFYAKT